MDIDVSPKMRRSAKAAGLTIEQMMFADLVAVGWSAEDAFIASFRKGSTWMKKHFAEEVAKQTEDEAVKSRIASTRGDITAVKSDAARTIDKKERDAIIDDAMSKEQMLFDLQTALTGMKAGSKEWLDTKKLIVEVTRMKQEDVAKDDSTIHYFLPVQYPTGCRDCLFSRCDTCRYRKRDKESEA